MDLGAFQPSPGDPGRRTVAVTPNDDDDLPGGAALVVALWGGKLAVVPADNADGDVVEFQALPMAFVTPFYVRRVKAAGTDANVPIIAVY
jgi:hypothetical protein